MSKSIRINFSKAMARATEIWSEATPLTFSEVSEGGADVAVTVGPPVCDKDGVKKG